MGFPGDQHAVIANAVLLTVGCVQRTTRDTSVSKARFLEAATRIHSKLAIAPSVPEVVHAKREAETSASASVPMVDDESILKMQVEIPYVPAAQRARANAPPVDDTLVVVGQPKKKKRKRAAAEKAGENDEAGSGGAGAVKEEVVEVAAFDYATAPNILDDGSDHEVADVRSAKKKRKQHGEFAFEHCLVESTIEHVCTGSNNSFYGNFPAPPKAHSQVKSGNQSRTFR